MVVIPYKDGDGSLRIRGKLGRPDLPDELGIKGIYQMRHSKHGLVQVKEKFYKPTGAPGPGQLIMRQKMRVCVPQWHAMSDTQKKRWDMDARTLGMTGFNRFLRDCLRFTVLPAGNFLLQENGSFIEQENGSKILL